MATKFSSFQKLQDFFRSKGSEIVDILNENGESCPLDHVPSGSAKVSWTCANNRGHIQTSQLKGVLCKKKELFVCRSCGISKSKGGPTYESFKESLEAEGWKMVSTKESYTNNKTMMNVKCQNNHIINTNQNRFLVGHRCKQCDSSSKRRRTIEDVSKQFESRGYKLLADTYTNNAILLDYVCKCGRERKISYANFIRNVDGCKECTRRWTYNDVEDFCQERGCELLDSNGGKPEFIINKTNITYVCFCGVKHSSTWKLFKNGARCPECTKRSIRDTCMLIYGTDNPSKSEHIKNKIKQTMMERYGVEYAMQVKEFCDRSKKTNIKNHNGVYNLNLPESRAISKKAYEDKYGAPFGFVEEHQKKAREETKKSLGVDYPLQSKEIQTKVKKNNLKKYGNEVFIASDTGKKLMLGKYGSEHYVTSEECKQRMMGEYGSEYYITSEQYTKTMIEKYGVPRPMQNPEILAKALYTSFSSKDYITPAGNILRIQGYENFALDDLINSGIPENDIVVGCTNIASIRYKFEGKDHVYYPDIYIKSKNLMIEVKSSYTYQRDRPRNIAKFQQTCKLHNFELWVYDSKGNRIVHLPFVDTKLNFIESEPDQ